ncbi:MAG: hypothetical protein ACXW32_06720, partial [Limisphaerales bacterium]
NYLSMSLNIPTADNDGNGIFDVLEQQQAASGQTSGAYTGSDGTIHSVRAIWNKAAGTNVGVCTIEFPDLGVTFEAVFENNHYSGTYDYSKTGSRLSGPLEANRNGAAQTTLTGDLNLRIVSPSLLAWGFGELQTDTSAPVAYEGSDLDRSAPFEYSAFFVTDDGDLTTAIPDYQIWLLVLPNIPDANNNGTPDLIEGGAAEDGPALALTLTGDALILTVTGGRGRTFDLETKSSVATTEAWTKVGTYTFTTDSETIPLVLSGVGNAFYRLKQ